MPLVSFYIIFWCFHGVKNETSSMKWGSIVNCLNPCKLFGHYFATGTPWLEGPLQKKVKLENKKGMNDKTEVFF